MEGSLIAKNPTAGRDFRLVEKIEAGIELKGSEVKSLRSRQANMRDSFARVEKGQIFLFGLDIHPYPQAGLSAPEPKRVRRLLLHQAQIHRLQGQVDRKGYTLIPTRLYFKGSLVKVELALAQGKRTVDKRETIKKRETDREIERALKRRS